ncbi:MAG: transglycosylase SLT domain-containing protein [Bdellovibrionaceae bacterium]|nr:transglycosylase SLT domain-containing protein [Pseudobdellovibrionaceae bacterium]NUM58546.1 transglycosylase SLT domain-containing protein [Pseudobdellovibrionaceae bacterium]
MKILTNFFIFIALLIPHFVNSQSDVFAKTRVAVQNNKWEEVIKEIDNEIKTNSTDKELLLFQKAYAVFQLKNFSTAEELFTLLSKTKNSFNEYTLYFLGLIQFQQNQLDKSKLSFELILKEKPNQKLKNEATFYLSQIALTHKNYQEAFNLLTKLDKATRGTEQHAEILYQLASAADHLNKKSFKCEKLLKIYIQYPQFEKVSHWDYNLNLNSINEKKSDCAWEVDDFKKRVRNLLWAGQEKKAFFEINKFKADFKGQYDFEADKILASFHAQEGNLDEAYGILKKYLKQNENDFEFLTQFAPIAARSGDLATSIAVYYKAYKLKKASDKGLQALFQSAFMSYQMQDYDWSTRKFKEFQKLTRNEKLKKESQWYLAWMKYLRGDYVSSFNEFKRLSGVKNKKKYKSLSQERLNYWMGMSLYRQNKLEKAKTYFAKLSLDKSKGYYSIAAYKRLEKINQEIKIQDAKESSIQLGMNSYKIPHKLSRFQMEDFLTPNNEEVLVDDDSMAENQDIEEEADPFEPGNVAESTTEKPEIDKEKSLESEDIPFKTPELISRFERARGLMIIGLDQWAKWDLYEIERRTKNKDYLKALMNEYLLVGQFHRSSQISQVYFSKTKAQLGIIQGKQFWEYSFPKAYPQFVDKYSKEFEVNKELVWSIMRAESQYRKEAISPVGALGLMQVMPYTGNKIAEIIGEKQFTPNQLLEAEPAIKIGTKYLQRLNKKFNQALPLVAASYNAGPHRVKNWLQLFGHLETDEFIEHIPFLETRNYVKKVIANSYIYALLYNSAKADQVPFLSDKMPFTLKERAPTKETWEEI